MLLGASEILKKIVEEDPNFKAEVKMRYYQVEEFKKWIVLVMKEVTLIADKISELESFIEIFPVRLQQLSSITVIGTDRLLPAFKIFFNILQATISSHARYVKYVHKDLESNFSDSIFEECEKLSELKRIFDRSEEKYEVSFNRYASTSRPKEPVHSSSIQEELTQLQELRYQYFIALYSLYTSLCKFQQNSLFTFFTQLFFISNSFDKFCKEQESIREGLLEVSDDLHKNVEKLKSQKEETCLLLDNQELFFQKALKTSSQEPSRIVPSSNISDFKIEKSQVLFVKATKNWKKAFVQLKNGYLSVTWIGSKSSNSNSAPSSNNQAVASSNKSISIPILLAEVKTIGVPYERKFCFELVTPQQPIFFQTETEEAMLDWLKCIDSAKNDAIKYSTNLSPAPNSPALSTSSSSIQMNPFIVKLLDGETVFAIFNACLQKETQIHGTAFFTMSRFLFVLGSSNDRGSLVIQFNEVTFVEMENFNLYDLVRIKLSSIVYSFKFFNQEGKIFFHVFKYLRENCEEPKSPGQIELKITEIMKTCTFDDVDEKESIDGSQRNLLSSQDFHMSASSIHCNCSSHYENVLFDSVIKFDIDSIVDVWFGKENNYVGKFLVHRNCKDISVGNWEVNNETLKKYREISYIMPLNSAFAKEVRCAEIMEIISEEEGVRCVIEVRVKTFDVPYSGYFDTLIRFCLTGGARKATHILITATTVWHKWTALKSIIMKQTRENMKEIVTSSVSFLIEDLKRKFPDFAASNSCNFSIQNESSRRNTKDEVLLCDSQRFLFATKVRKSLNLSNLYLSFVVFSVLIIAFKIFVTVSNRSSNAPYPIAFLQNACTQKFLFEKRFLPIDILKGLDSNSSKDLQQLMRVIRTLRKKNAKSFVELLQIEKKITDLFYSNQYELLDTE